MANELLAILIKLTAAVSIAALVIVVLRRTLRTQFGATAAYCTWLLLPVAVIAAALPPLDAGVNVELGPAPLAGLGKALAAPAVDAQPSRAAAVLLVWAAGMLLIAAVQLLRYRAFVQRLGLLPATDGAATLSASGEGPFLLGVLRPTIVLPADFERRYTAKQRELVLAHERMHAQRGDPVANALFALAQCVWWFNPLVHIAAARFRLDQEFACDQAVMRLHPGSAHAYAEAMLNTQLSHQRTPFACQWQSHHPLKERILNLNRTKVGAARRIAGRVTVALLLAAGGLSAWASQGTVEGGPMYGVAMRLNANGTEASPRIVTRAGEEASVSVGPDDKRLNLTLKLTPSGKDGVYLHSTLTLNGEVISKPVLLMKTGRPGTIAVAKDGADFRMEFTVSEEKPAS